MNILSKNQVFMDGSTSKKSYLKISQMGNMAVGLKILGLAPSEVFGVTGQTIFAYKIRVAPDTATPQQGQIYAMPAEAFPNIEWQKSDATRASLGLSMFFPASLTTDSTAGAEIILERLESSLAERIYTDIAQHIGEEYIRENRETIITWLDQEIDTFRQLLKKFIEGKTAVTQTYSENGETLTFMENSIKQALSAKKPTTQ